MTVPTKEDAECALYYCDSKPSAEKYFSDSERKEYPSDTLRAYIAALEAEVKRKDEAITGSSIMLTHIAREIEDEAIVEKIAYRIKILDAALTGPDGKGVVS